MYAKTNAFTRERERVKHSPFKFIFFVWLGVISLVFQNLFLFSNSLMVKAEEPKVETKEEQQDKLLQFTSNDSVVGFNNEGVIIANKDKALKIGFVDSNKVTPTQESSIVTYTSLWEGVNVTYEQTPDSIFKSTYYLNNPDKINSIQLHYNRPVELDKKGNLIIKIDTGNLTEQAPTAYQETPQGKHIVDVSFNLLPNGTIGFTITNFLPNFPVVIDPALTWNTFLGGSGGDQALSIILDSSGNIYIAGYSNTTWGTPVRAYVSSFDTFVAKINNNGTLVWNTFIGGAGIDALNSISLDATGNIFVTGWSNATWGTPVRAKSSGNDAYVAKLDTNGSLTWNTFLGGSGSDQGQSITLDSSGNIYVVGSGSATWGSPVRSYTSGYDAFIAKLDNNGNLTWNTFLGGSGSDQGQSITLDSSGNIYVGAQSNVTWGSPIRSYTASDDAFVAKLDNNGNLTWNTFLGGSGSDAGRSIVLDASRNIYIGGLSDATWGSPIRSYTSGNDAFVAKLDTNGSLIWNTFLGGSGTDYGYSISIDSNNNVYIGGYGNVTWGSPIRSYTASDDAFVAKLEGFPSVSNVSADVTTGGATITWTTDIISSTKVDYGTTTAYGSSTTETDTTSRATSHSVVLTNLAGCTNYHYRVRGSDAGSTEGVSGDHNFTTAGCSETSTTPETYQVSGEVLQTTTTETVLSPTKDSNQGEQKVVAILPPQTFNFNAFLSSQISNIIYSGSLTSVGKVQEIWYKAYAPEGYTPQKITTSLQTKPSIISLSYTGTYKNLKIAYSLDGKTWKVLSNSVQDSKNKTVAAITKLGGYYTLVSTNSTSLTPVLGTTTEITPSPTPVVTQIPKSIEKETVQKETTINKIIEFFKNILIKLRK